MSRWLRWFGHGLVSHGWTKASALVIALVFFIATRDDISRSFTIPLKAHEDPNRVLLTKLPQTVTVELHGSWARMSRLAAQDLGVAEIDLSDARPGPLAIEPAAIVMPEGVIFRAINYERVDLRFDRVIERAVDIEPVLHGVVHPDYELTQRSVEPPRWRLQGGSGPVNAVASLRTEPIDIDGATSDLVIEVPLQRPSDDINFTATTGDEVPRVKVNLIIRPRLGIRKVDVPVVWPVDQVAPRLIQTQVSVVVRGSLPDLAIFEAAPAPPLIADVHQEAPSPEFPHGAVSFSLRFTDALPLEVKARLTPEAELPKIALAPTEDPTPPPAPPGP